MASGRTGETPDAALTRLSGASLADETSFLLARANALAVAKGNSTLAPLGLKVRSYSVLALASDGEQPSQRDLAAYLRLDPSQVVALVDDLEGRGLVARAPDPRDRRANAVVATQDGRELASRARTALADDHSGVLTNLDANERATLSALLRRVAFSD